MKANISFDLDKYDDFVDFKCASGASPAYRLLWDIKEKVIPEFYGSLEACDNQEAVIALIDCIHKLYDEYDLDLRLGEAVKGRDFKKNK